MQEGAARMKYDLVIFDFDYTLADASESIIEGFYYAFDYLNIKNINKDRIRETIGMSLKDAYKYLLGKFNKTKFEIFYEKFIEFTDTEMIKNTMIYEGVEAVLDTLHSNGVRTAILTNKFSQSVEEVLQRDGLIEKVDYIIGSNDLSTSKPNPEGLNKILDKFGIDRDNAVYVGDHCVDAQAAEAANIDFLGVTSGVTKYEELEKYDSVGIVKYLNDVLCFF